MAYLRPCFVFSLVLASCSPAKPVIPDTPQQIYPNPGTFGARDRNYGLTESLDGTIRAFVGQRSDKTNIYISRKRDGTWTEPEMLQFPARETVMSPHFSPLDGRLYFATDAQHPGRIGREDLNLWSGRLQDDNTLADARPLPDAINTGAHEDSIAFDAAGRFIFSSDHTRGVGGFDLYYGNVPEAGQEWTFTPMPHNTRMADTQVTLTRDGQTAFYYAHLPEVLGVVDIFRIDRTGDTWSEPVNLGPGINGPGIDYGPGISADQTRFYYSQDGQMMEIGLQAALKASSDN